MMTSVIAVKASAHTPDKANVSGSVKCLLNSLQNHTSQSEVGAIFQKLQPRLAIATHLSVNEYSIVPILSGILSTYPTGPLAIAQDFSVWDISPHEVSQRKVGSICAETIACSKLFMAGHVFLFVDMIKAAAPCIPDAQYVQEPALKKGSNIARSLCQ